MYFDCSGARRTTLNKNFDTRFIILSYFPAEQYITWKYGTRGI
jgi:hypothetical protein